MTFTICVLYFLGGVWTTKDIFDNTSDLKGSFVDVVGQIIVFILFWPFLHLMKYILKRRH